MMNWWSGMIASSIAIVLTAGCTAQGGESDEERFNRRDLTIENEVGLARASDNTIVYSYRVSALAGPWRVISIGIGQAAVGRGAQEYFLVRYFTEDYGVPPKVTWADSRTCPAVEEVLRDLRDIPLERVKIPELKTLEFLPPRGPGPDGVTEVLWLRAESSTVLIEGFSEATAWRERTIQRLAPCWSETHSSQP